MKRYLIKKTDNPYCDAEWDKADIAQVECSRWEWVRCPYAMTAKLLYTDEALYVRMKTNETRLRAVNTEHNQMVCEDSCMELFLSPNGDDPRYFNFEINPIGTAYTGVCNGRPDVRPLDVDTAIFDIKTAIDRTGWELSYKIPFSYMREHFGHISNPMRGNFYKCGDLTVVPHCAVWNDIELDSDEFHAPQFFGELVFEGDGV